MTERELMGQIYDLFCEDDYDFNIEQAITDLLTRARAEWVAEKQSHIVHLEQRIASLKNKNAALQPRPEAPADRITVDGIIYKPIQHPTLGRIWAGEATEPKAPTSDRASVKAAFVAHMSRKDINNDASEYFSAGWDAALLSRAPRAKSDDWSGWNGWKSRAEAAEAERDKLANELRFVGESVQPLMRINDELRAECDRLKEEVKRKDDGWAATSAEYNKLRAENDRLKDNCSELSAEVDRLRRESEKLKDRIYMMTGEHEGDCNCVYCKIIRAKGGES